MNIDPTAWKHECLHDEDLCWSPRNGWHIAGAENLSVPVVYWDQVSPPDDEGGPWAATIGYASGLMVSHLPGPVSRDAARIDIESLLIDAVEKFGTLDAETSAAATRALWEWNFYNADSDSDEYIDESAIMSSLNRCGISIFDDITTQDFTEDHLRRFLADYVIVLKQTTRI